MIFLLKWQIVLLKKKKWAQSAKKKKKKKKRKLTKKKKKEKKKKKKKKKKSEYVPQYTKYFAWNRRILSLRKNVKYYGALPITRNCNFQICFRWK